jgi:phosphomannomutase
VGGLIITASHNPKEYNGFKAYNDDGGQILPPAANEIRKYMGRSCDILDISYARNEKLIGYINNRLINKYMHDAQQALVNKSIINKKKSYPVVVTTHHGTASKLLPQFLKGLKYNVKPVVKQCFVSPDFPNSPIANPEVMESFDLSIKQANVLHGDICIGVDPDADRMAVCIKHNNK